MSGSYKALVNFADTNGNDPYAGVTEVDGVLYGATSEGGAGYVGTLFSYDIESGQFQTLFSFKTTPGAYPDGDLTDIDGTLYGTTVDSGAPNKGGSLFAYNIETGQMQTLVTFNENDGDAPLSGVTPVNGVLYGTTDAGGAAGYGTLYAYEISTGQFQTLVNFNTTTGINPWGAVVNVNGTLYGTTTAGGASSDGTLFAYNIASAQYQTLVSFNGTNGADSQAAVTEDNGVLYGTTKTGGASTDGTLFSYDLSTGQLQTLVSFDGTDGSYPYDALLDVNGVLYGTTSSGATTLDGTLFSYDIAAGQFQTLYIFANSTGSSSLANLIDVSGTLYGTTSLGGSANGGVLFSYEIACFCRGTRILTERGEIAVEDLRAGDRALTCLHGAILPARIVWIGQRRVDIASHPHPEFVRPIRFAPGALGDGVPHRSLLLSPDHALLVEGHLIAARQLVNGCSITVLDVPSVQYFHVELERHSVLLAEGAKAESYLDTGNRRQFSNAGVAVSLFADFSRADHPQAFAPLVTDAALVRPIWQRLKERAMIGHVGTIDATADLVHDPDLRLVGACGRSLKTVHVNGRVHSFALPPDVGALRLLSNAGRPSETIGPFVDDRRDLGVLVGRITIRHDGDVAAVTAHLAPGKRRGWHDPEAGARFRWTDGDAALPIDLRQYDRQGVLLEIEVVSAGPYLAPASGRVATPSFARPCREAWAAPLARPC